MCCLPPKPPSSPCSVSLNCLSSSCLLLPFGFVFISALPSFRPLSLSLSFCLPPVSLFLLCPSLALSSLTLLAVHFAFLALLTERCFFCGGDFCPFYYLSHSHMHPRIPRSVTYTHSHTHIFLSLFLCRCLRASWLSRGLPSLPVLSTCSHEW